MIVPVVPAIFVIFSKLVPASRGNLPYVPSAFAGMILWQLFTRGVSEGATSLTANAALITKVYFPRIVLPLAASHFLALFDVLISLILLAGVLAWFQIPLQMPMLMAPLFVIQVALTVLAFSLWLSAIDGIFRDLRHALPLILQTPGCSSVRWPTRPRPSFRRNGCGFTEYNPLVGPLEGFRWALLQRGAGGQYLGRAQVAGHYGCSARHRPAVLRAHGAHDGTGLKPESAKDAARFHAVCPCGSAGMAVRKTRGALPSASIPSSTLPIRRTAKTLILRRLFEGQKQGFYVDIGAHHPFRFSNTCYFHRRGWTGLNVDPNLTLSRHFIGTVRPTSMFASAFRTPKGSLPFTSSTSRP